MPILESLRLSERDAGLSISESPRHLSAHRLSGHLVLHITLWQLFRGTRHAVRLQFSPRTLLLIHATPFARHKGVNATCRMIKLDFYWPNMDADIKCWIQECLAYQRNKSSHDKPADLLQPLPIPTRRWSDVSMDFMTHLPKTRSGNTATAATMVVVERLSKLVHFIPTVDTANAAGTNFHLGLSILPPTFSSHLYGPSHLRVFISHLASRRSHLPHPGSSRSRPLRISHPVELIFPIRSISSISSISSTHPSTSRSKPSILICSSPS